MMRFATLVLLGLFTMSVIGCDPPRYLPPQLPSDQTATIVGSNGAGTNGARTRLITIDGKYVSTDPRNSNDPFVISGGTHVIRFFVLDAQDRSGDATTSFVAEPGNEYFLRASDPMNMNQNCSRSTIWVEKKDGTRVNEPVESALLVTRKSTEMMAGGVYVMVPPRPVTCPPLH